MIEMSALAHDMRPPDFEVRLSFSPKKRELFFVVDPKLNLRVPRKVYLHHLFEAPYRDGINLVKTDGAWLRQGNVSPDFRTQRLSCSMLVAAASSNSTDRPLHTRFVVYRFLPFMPQHLGCVKAKFVCDDCPLWFQCESGAVPLGIFVELNEHVYASRSVSLSPTQAKIYNSIIDVKPSSQKWPDMLVRYATLQSLFGDSVLPLYGDTEVFETYPEFKDVFRLA